MKRYQGVDTLEVLQFATNYNQWIADTFTQHIQTPFIEIGSGTGNLSKFFISHTPYVMSDVDSNLVSILKKKFKQHDGITFIKLDVMRKPTKTQEKKYASLLGINVLEHIEDDEKTLSNFYNLLRKNGKLLLLVPAKQLAYTRFDESLGHFRRYEKEELKRKVERAGFVIEDLYFFNLIGLLSWVIRDKVERKHIHMKSYQVKLFDWIVPIVRSIETHVRPPVGVSLILIAHKK